MAKKFLTAIVLLAASICILASCGNDNNVATETPEKPEHTHSFSEWTTAKEASCDAEGIKERICSCGEKETESIPINHTFSEKMNFNLSVHNQTCTKCSKPSEPEKHTFDESGKCTVCNSTMKETDGISYKLSDDGSYAIVEKYEGSETNVVIAEKYNGKPVKVVDGYAFSNCINNIETITFPDTVEFVWQAQIFEALDANEYKNALYLGNNVNPYLILLKAKDTSITTCEIADTTAVICVYAFRDCKNLESLSIPESVRTVSSGVFINCESLTSIDIPNTVTTFETSDIFKYCSSLTEIILPDCVTNIGYYAFYNCESLTEITIPKNVKEIRDWAFDNCDELITVNFKGTMKAWNNLMEKSSFDTFGITVTCSNGTIEE